MATLSFEGTITPGALSYVTGITDLDLIEEEGALTLFATTQVVPGVTAFGLGADGQPDWIDRLSLGAQAAATALPPELEFVEIGGTTMAVPVGLNGPGIQGYALSAQGLSHTPTDLAAAASPVAKLVAVQVGGSTFLYVSQDETPGLIAYDLAGSQVAGGGSGELITDFTALTLADTAFLLATSSSSDAIILFQIGANGAPQAVGSIGAAQGLGIADPTAVGTAVLNGVTYGIVASAGSSSLSVVAVQADGSLTVTDHILDTLDTRFYNAAVLEVVQLGTRVFVLAAGSDDGLSLFELLPGGQLFHLASMADSTEMTLQNASAIAAAVAGTTLDVFVASQSEPGITHIQVDLGALGLSASGTPGGDTLSGGADDDVLAGGNGNDVIHGGGGHDILMDGAGSDTLSGSAGADIFVLGADGTPDTIADFQQGIDKIDLSSWPMLFSTGALQITSTQSGAVISHGDETLIVTNANGGSLSELAVLGAITFNVSRPLLLAAGPPAPGGGTPAPDTLYGTDGPDLIDGAASGDYIFGGLDGDTLLGGPGDDTIDGSGGLDKIDGGAGNDFLIGDNGADLINGGSGDDTILGQIGYDHLNGGAGNDIVNGDSESDLMHGNDGDDTVRGGFQEDRLYGDAGNDIVLGDAGFDVVDGGLGNDTVNGGGQADYVYGGVGHDLLLGETGDDRLYGGAGNDTGYGGPQNDALFGEAGHDRLFGQSGDDRLFGGDGDDLVDGGAGDDKLAGHGGFDTLVGSTGNDVMAGGANADTFVFASNFGQDVITDFDATNNYEKIDLSYIGTIVDFADLVQNHMSQHGADVIINAGGGNTIKLLGVSLAELGAADFIF